jgi:hypothetical protein
MTTITAPAGAPSRHITPKTAIALTGAAVAAALVPVVFGVAFLVSVLIHRPLVAVLARRWRWLAGVSLDMDSPGIQPALSRVTTVWGVVLLAVGILQGIGAMMAGLSITNPASVAVRTLFALAVLAAMSIGTSAYLRRTLRA